VSLVVVEWFSGITSTNISSISRAAHSFSPFFQRAFDLVECIILFFPFKDNFDSLYLFFPRLIHFFFFK
jgi:hypothetical protein